MNASSQGWDTGGTADLGERPQRTGLRRFVPTWRMVLGGFLLLGLLLGGAFAAGYLLVDIPAANAAAKAQSNIYLYRDGTEIAREGEVNRESVPLSQVPKQVQRAVLAAEDRDFYGESAINPVAMARAAWNTVRGEGKQSGSTITQQYVKNYYLNQEQTLSRKAKEFFIAIKLDNEKTKDDILEGYLNTSYYGRGAYGIQAAAQAYFGKDAGGLTVSEGAYLATLLNAPGLYDVVANPDSRAAARSRWNYVLDGMVKSGWLSESRRAGQRFPQPEPVKPPTSLAGQDGYLVEAAKRYLIEHDVIDERTLAAGGYRITTTIDRKKQDAFAAAAKEELLDKLNPKARKVDRYVRAGGASVEPRTGKVVALYGGVDYLKQYANNATRHDYQVGSTFKPFVLTAAVDRKATTQSGEPITPNSVYDGTNRREVEGRDGPTGYRPENEDQHSYGRISVSRAMNSSVNAVFAQMGEDVGQRRVKDTAIALGLPKNTPSLTTNPSMAIGTATPSALELAGAYATLAGHGNRIDPWLVAKVTKDREEITLPEHTVRRAVSREAADTTTEVLQGVVSDPGGTGSAALALNRPVAAKTGTAEEDKAAWFAGYTPQLATVVAVMGQDPKAPYGQKALYGAAGLARVNGGGPPAEIWTRYMESALLGAEVQDFVLETNDDQFTPPPVEESPSTDDGGTTEPSTEPPTEPEPPTSEPPTTEPPTTDGGTSEGDGGGTVDGGTDTGGTDTGGADSGTTHGGGTGGDQGGTDVGSIGEPSGGPQAEST